MIDHVMTVYELIGYICKNANSIVNLVIAKGGRELGSKHVIIMTNDEINIMDEYRNNIIQASNMIGEMMGYDTYIPLPEVISWILDHNKERS